MKRKRMPPEEFDEYQAGFRYPNITMGWIHSDDVDQYLPQIESYLNRPKMAPYKQFEDPLMVTYSTITRRYVTGRPMAEVYEIIHMSIRIFSKILAEGCRKPTPDNLEKLFCGNAAIEHYLCECLLIADNDYLAKWIEQVESLLSHDLQDVGESGRLLRIPFVRMLLAIAKKDAEEKIVALTRESYRENLNTFEYSMERELEDIGLGGAEGVNKNMQKRALNLFGSERSRARKKARVSDADRFSYKLLLQMALALHRGVSIRFRDSGIPIGDFPIARLPHSERLLLT